MTDKFILELPLILPSPQSLKMSGGYCHLDRKLKLISDPKFSSEKSFLLQLFPEHLPDSGKHSLTCYFTSITSSPESYQLTIEPDKIIIAAANSAGIFYGISTLAQLIRQYGNILPCLEIIDAPAFSWRGLHLDVCRHFFSTDYIKKLLDVMAAYKLNRFHWHLTDDQGWRIAIDQYPLLTETGAWRKDEHD